MPDIVEKLRSRKAFFRNGATWCMSNEPDEVCEEAAQEIERLRAEHPDWDIDDPRWLDRDGRLRSKE